MDYDCRMICIRAYRLDEAAVMGRLYAASVRALAGGHYEADQIETWAGWGGDADRIGEQLAKGGVRIAEINGHVAGLGQLCPVDHVAMLYVDPEFARRGVATALMSELEAEARAAALITELTTSASRVSRTFFERVGFEVIENVIAELDGVQFERFRMMKRLA